MSQQPQDLGTSDCSVSPNGPISARVLRLLLFSLQAQLASCVVAAAAYQGVTASTLLCTPQPLLILGIFYAAVVSPSLIMVSVWWQPALALGYLPAMLLLAGAVPALVSVPPVLVCGTFVAVAVAVAGVTEYLQRQLHLSSLMEE